MAPLRRAVSLEQVHHVTVIVGEDLHLDVTWVRDQPLDVQRAVAESGRRFAPRRLDRFVNLDGLEDVAHPLAAAAGRRLDERGQADALDRLTDAAIGLIAGCFARHDRHAGRGDQSPRVDLRSHLRDDVRRRPDEDQSGGRAGGRERRVLGEKSVARVDGIRARRARGLEQLRHAEVAVVRGRRPDGDRMIRRRDVPRRCVGGRVDGDALYPHLGARADDADRNLAAVGDQEALDHC